MRWALELWHVIVMALLWVAGRTCYKIGVPCVAWAETDAVSEGIDWGINNSVNNIIIESDCAAVINRNKVHEDVMIMGFILSKIMTQTAHFSYCNCTWCPRSANKVANRLSKIAYVEQCSMSFDMDYPRSIHEDVIFYCC